MGNIQPVLVNLRVSALAYKAGVMEWLKVDTRHVDQSATQQPFNWPP